MGAKVVYFEDADESDFPIARIGMIAYHIPDDTVRGIRDSWAINPCDDPGAVIVVRNSDVYLYSDAFWEKCQAYNLQVDRMWDAKRVIRDEGRRPE
jgi:hypothetical protein